MHLKLQIVDHCGLRRLNLLKNGVFHPCHLPYMVSLGSTEGLKLLPPREVLKTPRKSKSGIPRPISLLLPADNENNPCEKTENFSTTIKKNKIKI